GYTRPLPPRRDAVCFFAEAHRRRSGDPKRACTAAHGRAAARCQPPLGASARARSALSAPPREFQMFANQTWKPPLLRKGKEVAELLEAVLWGKELDLACLPAPASPGEDPELRLRSFLE